LGGVVGLIAIVGLIFGFVIVRPALAQEEATATAPIVDVAPPVDIGSSSTSNDSPVDAAAPSATPAVEGASTSAVSADPPPPPPPQASTSATPTEPPPVGLTQVHIIGTKYVDYFTDGTTVTSYPGDPQIDAHLAEKDAPIPSRPGLMWVHTTGGYLYDTASGDLEVGQYAVQPDGSYIQKGFPFVSSTSTPATADSSSASSSQSESGASSTQPSE
jgi:hypothetical protein